MPGVKIHHKTDRNTNLVFELPDRPYPVPFLCSTCDKSHTHKALHIRLDENGDAFIAEETWDIIRSYLGPEFQDKGLEQDVPPMVLGMEGKKEKHRVKFKEAG